MKSSSAQLNDFYFFCNIFIVFSLFHFVCLLGLSETEPRKSGLSGYNKKGAFPISLLSHLFTHTNIFRIHQLFILTISCSFSVCMFAKTWSKTPNHKKAAKKPGNLLCLAVSCLMLNLDRFFPSRYLSHASIVRFHLVRFFLPYCELKYLLQSNYRRDLGQRSVGNRKKCGPQHWHKHLSMLEEASLPLNRADAS